MEDGNPAREYEARAQKVRAHLKQWEADFAKTHDGRKPGREDIKNNPAIAQKYKDYNKLRDIISGKVPLPTTNPPREQQPELHKRKPDAPSPAGAETPLKKSKQFATPAKDQDQAYVDSNGYMVSPAVSRKLFSPAAVTCLGPTPQRDGKVLGLFDLLVEKELGLSPNKPGQAPRGGPPQGLLQATPRKRTDGGQGGRFARTPTSSSRRQGPGSAATPHRKKDGGEPGTGTGTGTPSSASRLAFDTPAFLRRQKLPTSDESSSFADAPERLRLPRKPFARGLSEIITSLRKVEEEQADEDLEALREALSGEAELGRPLPPKPTPVPPPGPSIEQEEEMYESEILKPDTDQPLLLGGFDDEGLYDSVAEEDGRPARVYKKKGQKRTTRRVNIKPTRHKRAVNAAAAADDGSQDEEGDGREKAESPKDAEDEFVDDSGEDDDDDDDDNGGKKKKNKNKNKKNKEPDTAKHKGGTVKKAARKVNELAHANFQRLKLRNHGAKGGPGHNSRFRRRR